MNEEDDSESSSDLEEENGGKKQDDMFKMEEDPLDIEPEESKISKVLSDKITKIVILLVLSLIFLLPFCSAETYTDHTLVHE